MFQITPPARMTRQELEDELVFRRAEMGVSPDEAALGALMAHGLKRREARLLWALYRSPSRVLSTLRLLDAMGIDPDREPCRSTVNVYVRRLRKSLGSAIIRTAWDEGFQITGEGTATVAAILSGQQ